MVKKLSERFGEWATRYKAKFATDPFLSAKIKIGVLFFLVAAVISVVIGELVDQSVVKYIYEVYRLESEPIEPTLALIQRDLWFGRAVRLVLFVLAAYSLAAYAMRPIKKSATLQKNFMANVSHELRTPLAVLKSDSELLLRNYDKLPKDQIADLLKSNVDEVDRMSQIIQFLFTVSDFEQLGRPFVTQKIDLSQIIYQVVKRHGEMTGRKVTIERQLDANSFVMGSEIALQEMANNLIKNAVDHTPDGGRVTIVVKRANDDIQLTVSDSGTGVDSSDLPYLFEPFYKGQNKAWSDQKKYGIGLSIVKQVVKMHGGTITAANNPGRGMTFTVGLKRAD